MNDNALLNCFEQGVILANTLCTRYCSYVLCCRSHLKVPIPVDLIVVIIATIVSHFGNLQHNFEVKVRCLFVLLIINLYSFCGEMSAEQF